MKKQLPLVLFLMLLSCLSGYLMSKPSLVGRIGMDLFYKQYRILKTWWQSALLIFIVWMILLLLQRLFDKKLPVKKSRMIQVAGLLFALTGLYFTWYDFNHTTTHRWLKERFHIGAYLFWLGWILISISLLVHKKNEIKVS